MVNYFNVKHIANIHAFQPLFQSTSVFLDALQFSFVEQMTEARKNSWENIFFFHSLSIYFSIIFYLIYIKSL